MSDVYTGRTMDKRYTGDSVDVTYSPQRCIHAAECVRRLSEVFDNQRRPWINPNGSSADRVAEVVERCPSGALHYERKDGGADEAPAAANTITLWHNGPLQLTGALQIEGATVHLEGETRATLCRCGASHNKPFCDNSHKDSGFDGTPASAVTAVPNTEGGVLKIIVTPNGSLGVQGNFTLLDEQGKVLFAGEKTWLCRCGGSASKPFCDGTHKRNGFTGE